MRHLWLLRLHCACVWVPEEVGGGKREETGTPPTPRLSLGSCPGCSAVVRVHVT